MDDKMVRLLNIYDERFGTGYAGNVWWTGGVSPALMTMQGGSRTPMVATYEEIGIRSVKVKG